MIKNVNCTIFNGVKEVRNWKKLKTKNVGENDLNNRMKYVMVRLYN